MRLRSASKNNYSLSSFHFDEGRVSEYLRIAAASQLLSENLTSIVAASSRRRQSVRRRAQFNNKAGHAQEVITS